MWTWKMETTENIAIYMYDSDRNAYSIKIKDVNIRKMEHKILKNKSLLKLEIEYDIGRESEDIFMIPKNNKVRCIFN
jgi:hypothetical protein